MKKKWNLAALLPGFLSLNSAAALSVQDSEVEDSSVFLKGVIIAPLNIKAPLYIAGHRSHSSHGSHRSSSGSGSRSYSPPAAPARTPARSRQYNSDSLGQPSTPSYTAPKNLVKKDKNQFDRATLIMRVQLALRMLGYYTGSPDGVMGPLTRSAIKRYRGEKGLGTSDVIDVLILNSLGISAP
jgi:His-Xaa-Ser repeat protein HxsA